MLRRRTAKAPQAGVSPASFVEVSKENEAKVTERPGQSSATSPVGQMRTKHAMKIKSKKSFVLNILLILIVSGYASAREPGAGGVLYTTIQGSTYVLLADHSYNDRGWAAFGGRLDGQAPRRAAAREIEEETNGLVNRKWALEQLSSSPCYTVRDGTWHYTMYFLEIPFKPAVQFTSTKPPKNLKGADERGPYSWVPLSVLMKAVEQYRSGVKLVSVPNEGCNPKK